MSAQEPTLLEVKAALIATLNLIDYAIRQPRESKSQRDVGYVEGLQAAYSLIVEQTRLKVDR